LLFDGQSLRDFCVVKVSKFSNLLSQLNSMTSRWQGFRSIGTVRGDMSEYFSKVDYESSFGEVRKHNNLFPPVSKFFYVGHSMTGEATSVMIYKS
jgi:hypothetical protein